MHVSYGPDLIAYWEVLQTLTAILIVSLTIFNMFS